MHTLPLYLYIRLNDSLDDEEQVTLVEGALCGGGPTLAAPDQYLVLAPRFSLGGPTDSPLKWQTHLLGSVSQLSAPLKDEAPPARRLGPPTVEEKVPWETRGVPVGDTAGVADKAEQAHMGAPVYLTPSTKDLGDAEAQASWKNQLESLAKENPASILVARGITKLGYESAERLREHFSHLCALKAIHVPYALKKHRPKSKAHKQRVAGRCMIVMNSPEEAARILAQGPEYLVDGVAVMLEPFKQGSQDSCM